MFSCCFEKNVDRHLDRSLTLHRLKRRTRSSSVDASKQVPQNPRVLKKSGNMMKMHHQPICLAQNFGSQHVKLASIDLVPKGSGLRPVQSKRLQEFVFYTVYSLYLLNPFDIFWLNAVKRVTWRWAALCISICLKCWRRICSSLWCSSSKTSRTMCRRQPSSSRRC